jgi:hypothetical protein
MKCWSIAAAIIVTLAPSAALMTSAKAAGLPPETTVKPGCRPTRDGSRRRHLGTHRRRSCPHHRRWRDTTGFAGRRQGLATEPQRPQTAARHRHDHLQLDVLDYARQQNLFPDIESGVTYVAKLYNEEFHLLARKDIAGVTELANQKANVDLRGAGTAITAARLFDL